MSLEAINEDRDIPLILGDYDFTWDFTDDAERFQEMLQQSEEGLLYFEEWYQQAPTFYAEYESGVYEAAYHPEHVIVLIDSETRSAGNNMAVFLHFSGATLVGTPPTQAGNFFGEGLSWQLDHTGIEGTVSQMYATFFPDDPEAGRALPIDYPLTYEVLASYDFDPNAEYLYALDVLAEWGE
jgi:hypothetical protein